MAISIADKFYAGYFVLHTLVTAMDCGALIRYEERSTFHKNMFDIMINKYEDPLMKYPPAFLYSFLLLEAFIQWPFFPYAAYSLYKGKKGCYVGILMYAVEATVTTFACLAEIYWAPTISESSRTSLLLIYSPTFFVPLVMMIDFGYRISKWVPANDPSKLKTK
ncbi:transmembrane protein 6/97 [Dipodascopsis uninucleata]